jgi:hypothetical protein
METNEATTQKKIKNDQVVAVSIQEQQPVLVVSVQTKAF